VIRAIVVVLAALLSAVAGAAPAGQSDAPLIVAHIVSDGELVPVARFDGTRWRNTWPEPIEPVFFIEASRQFSKIPSDTQNDAVSYRGWFRSAGGRGGALIPLSASVTTFSTAEGKSPRYTPIGILRLGAGAIWVMSDWGIESQTVVLFDVSAKGVRKLTSADISGC
jgi:hypothetical protein